MFWMSKLKRKVADIEYENRRLEAVRLTKELDIEWLIIQPYHTLNSIYRIKYSECYAYTDRVNYIGDYNNLHDLYDAIDGIRAICDAKNKTTKKK